MDFIIENLESTFTMYGMAFCAGFAFTVVLHYLSYAIFWVFGLLNIRK